MGTTLKCGIPRPGIPVYFFFDIYEFMGEAQDAAAAREEGDNSQDGEPLLD